MAGSLYVVSTPIGNLGDLTLRAIDVLKRVPRVIAEDTRRTRALLAHLGITGKALEACHAHSSAADVARLVGGLHDGDAALVTDAGTPAISDPGAELVRAALEAGVRVVPVPGASAVLAALVASGLAEGHGFRFFGFLPRDNAERSAALARVTTTPEPVVLFESPERAADTLRELASLTPTRTACVAREVTKLHEEFARGALEDLARVETTFRGEVVVVLGAWAGATTEQAVDDAALDARIEAELAQGAHAKTLAERLAAWSGRPRRDVYERVVARKQAAARR